MKRITLRAARANARLSKKKLADLMGVSEKSIYNWETGRTAISKASFLAFCSITGFEPGDIILPIEYLE